VKVSCKKGSTDSRSVFLNRQNSFPSSGAEPECHDRGGGESAFRVRGEVLDS
jgi:hypothetical protein